eukprot:111340-Pelagomonas_calceolata.AAC.1
MCPMPILPGVVSGIPFFLLGCGQHSHQIVKDKRTKKTKGFGFVSFMDSLDFAKALKEMNGKYIGNRPCKLRKSTWDERNAHLKKPQQQQQQQKK